MRIRKRAWNCLPVAHLIWKYGGQKTASRHGAGARVDISTEERPRGCSKVGLLSPESDEDLRAIGKAKRSFVRKLEKGKVTSPRIGRK